jgi:hypothetical protein
MHVGTTAGVLDRARDLPGSSSRAIPHIFCGISLSLNLHGQLGRLL